jgi:hypothetical protein
MKPGGHLLIDTAVYEGVQDSPLLYCPVGPESPYAVFGDSTSSTFFNEKGLVDTMEFMGFRHVSTGLVIPRWVDPFASRKHALKVAVKELFTGRQKRERSRLSIAASSTSGTRAWTGTATCGGIGKVRMTSTRATGVRGLPLSTGRVRARLTRALRLTHNIVSDAVRTHPRAGRGDACTSANSARIRLTTASNS